MAWIELKAFAAQSLGVLRTLHRDPVKVNPLGGATGAIRTATLLYGLQHTRQRYGMVTMCISTGIGAAGIFEALFQRRDDAKVQRDRTAKLERAKRLPCVSFALIAPWHWTGCLA